MAPKSEADKQAEIINLRQVASATHERVVDLQRALASVREDQHSAQAERSELLELVHRMANQFDTLLERVEDNSLRTDTYIVTSSDAFEHLRAAVIDACAPVSTLAPLVPLLPLRARGPERRSVQSK